MFETFTDVSAAYQHGDSWSKTWPQLLPSSFLPSYRYRHYEVAGICTFQAGNLTPHLHVTEYPVDESTSHRERTISASLHLPGVTQEQEMYCKVHVHVQYIPSLCRACAMCICGAGAATQPLEAEETRARVLLLLLSCPNAADMCCLFTFHCSLAFSSASLSVLERIRFATLSDIQLRGKTNRVMYIL